MYTDYLELAREIWEDISAPGTMLAEMMLEEFFYNDLYDRKENAA